MPEFDRDDVREVIIGSYRLVYRVSGSTVTMLTVFRSSRLFPLDDPDRVQ